MCGFVGLLTTGGSEASGDVVARMLASITHRGPDDFGTFLDGPCGFGFRRLSILDLTPTGHQPMSAAEGQVTIVFNGEIYNFIEVRRELEGRGHHFRSTGDCEVLLHAYLEWGTDCLTRLNGMWAFLIYDRRDGTLFGARDRFGIKPLFIARSKDGLLLGSEIKALLASGLVSPEIDWTAAAAFLGAAAIDESDRTFYRGIQQLGAAHAFVASRDGGFRCFRYWDVGNSEPESFSDPAEAYAELFEDAIRLHMRSDVPVAVHLSGGLDSSSILCAAARVRAAAGAAEPVTAFSFISRDFDESRYIRDTVAQSGANLVELDMQRGDLWKDVCDMLSFQDEPVQSLTAVVGYRLMRLTAEHGVKVVLNGQGADETLGGYPFFNKAHWAELIRSSRFGAALADIRTYAKTHKTNVAPLLQMALSQVALQSLQGIAYYRNITASARRRRLAANPWFDHDFLLAARPSPPKLDSTLKGALKWSAEHGPLPLYLRVEDRNSMAHSVEARVPFLDHRLVSFAWNLPSDWKLRAPWNKFVLRQAMEGRIPESVRMRPDKMGFPVPSAEWLATSLYEPVSDLLGSRSTRERGYYRVDLAIEHLERIKRGETRDPGPLFDIVQVELVAARAAEVAGLPITPPAEGQRPVSPAVASI